MKDAYYFPHDSNARNDPKIQALMSKWGYEGYGWWWAVLETLREQPGYKYPMISRHAINSLGRVFQTTNERAEEFINDCCHEFADERGGLLTIDDRSLWSESFSRRMAEVDAKRDKAKRSAVRRWENEKATRRGERPAEERTPEQKQTPKPAAKKPKAPRKTEYTSWDNPEATLRGKHVRLTDDEWGSMVDELGEQRANYMVTRFDGYVDQITERAARIKYKSHKATMMNWHRSDIEKGYFTPVQAQAQPQRSRYREVD